MRGFTLIEIIVVLSALIAILGILYYFINPVEFFKKSRDYQRINDLRNLELAISSFINANPNVDLDGEDYDLRGVDEANPTIFVSLPNDVATIPFATITDANGKLWYIVQNANSNTLTGINGKGWIPIDFTSIKIPLLTYLPVDPVNSYSSKLFYTYAFSRNKKEFELNANLEYIGNRYGGSVDKTSKDGGSDNEILEAGTNKCIIIGNRLYGEVSTTTCRQKITYSYPPAFLPGTGGGTGWFRPIDGAVQLNDLKLSQEGGNIYYLVAGTKAASQGLLPFLLKLDKNGNIISSTTFNVSTSTINSILVLDEDNDGVTDYYVLGGAYNFNATSSALVIKTNTSSNPLWISTSSSVLGFKLKYIDQNIDGNYIAFGDTGSSTYKLSISSSTGIINFTQIIATSGCATPTILEAISRYNSTTYSAIVVPPYGNRGYYQISNTGEISYCYVNPFDFLPYPPISIKKSLYDDTDIILFNLGHSGIIIKFRPNQGITGDYPVGEEECSYMGTCYGITGYKLFDFVQIPNFYENGFVSAGQTFQAWWSPYFICDLSGYCRFVRNYRIDSGSEKAVLIIAFTEGTSTIKSISKKSYEFLWAPSYLSKIIDSEDGGFVVIGYDGAKWGYFVMKVDQNGECPGCFAEIKPFNFLANIFSSLYAILRNLLFLP